MVCLEEGARVLEVGPDPVHVFATSMNRWWGIAHLRLNPPPPKDTRRSAGCAPGRTSVGSM